MTEAPTLIAVLFVAGFLLIVAEVFLPGLIVGAAGFLCLAASVAVVFLHYGAVPGTVAALVVGTSSAAGLILWLNIFPRTFIGRRIVLSRRQQSEPLVGSLLIGGTGLALTPLRPSGTASIRGKRVDVTAVGEFLEQGAGLVVVAADGMRVVVRRKDGLEQAWQTA